MPTNFNQTLQGVGGPDVTWETATSDAGASLTQYAGKAVSNLSQTYSGLADEAALSDFTEEAAGREAEVANFMQARNELLRQKTVADESIISDIDAKLNRLRQGRVQGALSPSQATVETSKLVKEYSVAYPHLAQHFRAAGNAARGNYDAIAREYGGEDPEQKAMLAVLEEAARTGATPQAVILSAQQKRASDLLENTAKMYANSGVVDSAVWISSAREVGLVFAAGVQKRLFEEGQRLQASGQPLTDSAIDAMIATEKNAWSFKFANDFELPYIESSGGKRQLTASDKERAIKDVHDSLDQLAVMLKGQSLENQLKFLEDSNKLNDELTARAVYEKLGTFNIMREVMGEDNFAQMLMWSSGVLNALAQQPNKQGQDTYIESLRRRAAADPKGGALNMTLDMIDAGMMPKPIMVEIANAFMGNRVPPEPGTEAQRAEDNPQRAFVEKMAVAEIRKGWTKIDPDLRKTQGPAVAKSLSWKEFSSKNSVDLYTELRDNPAVIQNQTDKFTKEVLASWQSGKALVYDPQDPVMPIKYRDPTPSTRSVYESRFPKPAYAEPSDAKELLEINKLFGSYRSVFGLEQFGKVLDSLGLRDSGPATEQPAEKKSEGIAKPPEQIGKVISEAASEVGVPESILAGVAFAESTFDPKAIGEETKYGKAEGMFQIMPSQHPDFKDTFDAGKSARYAANYLKQLHDQFGSWELALIAYNWGPGNLKDYGPYRAPSETRNFLAKVLEYAESYAG